MTIAAELDLVKVNVFLIASYIIGDVFELLKTSAILGHMLIGAILGPGLLSFVPLPHGLELAGMLGIQLEVIESGLATNLSTLRRLAPRALLIGVLGIILPLGGAVGVVCVMAVLEKTFSMASTLRVAFAVGAALAPTSLGVTATLLAEHGELDSELGQLISLSALFDDVLSLVLLAEVQAAAADTITAWTMVKPIVFSLVFIVGSAIAAFLLPTALGFIMSRAPVKDRQKWRLGLFLIFATAILASFAAYSAGTSFLLAAYLTGVAFADAEESTFAKPWKDHVRVHIKWLVLLFFAATIGFVVPLKALFTPSALAPGAVLALVSTLGKLLCGAGAKNKVDAVAVGVGMLARGEFGFLIAAAARHGGILSERIYAATIWGVLVPTILTPLFFGIIFRWRKSKIEEGTKSEVEQTQSEIRFRENKIESTSEDTSVEENDQVDANDAVV